MVREIGIEHTTLVDELRDVLYSEPSVVNQQIAIELLMAYHAGSVAGNLEEAHFVIDGMTKHAKQMIAPAYEETE